MNKKRKEHRELSTIITRRILLFSAGKALLGSLLMFRLYQLQITRNESYTKLSERNQYDKRLIQAPRGRILDFKKRLLAGNSEIFEMLLVPARVKDIDLLLLRLSKIINLSFSDIKKIKEKIDEQPDFLEVRIASKLSQRQLAKLAVLTPFLSGINFHKSYKRIYPQGGLTSHVTGYVSPPSKKDIKKYSEMRYLPSLKIGRVGVEKDLESYLKGTSGEERIEVNARGKPVRIINDKFPSPGDDINLTIDIEAQLFSTNRLRRGSSKTVSIEKQEVQKALFENEELKSHITLGDDLILKDIKGRFIPPESGAIVVMNVETGEIPVFVSLPSYDPNNFSESLSHKDWNRLNSHPRKPLLNRVVSGLYSPGSTFKMVVLAAALESGVISSKTKFECKKKGEFDFGNTTFHCWNKHGHGNINCVQAIEQSCDIFFYQIALLTGIEKIHNMAIRLGLGEVSDLNFSGEKKGIIPNRKWKIDAKGRSWTPGETVISGIGQGFVLTTPLQLAVMTARIANGLKAVHPKLHRNNNRNKKTEPLQINKSIINLLQKGMIAVSNGSKGTARKYKLKKFGLAGKTGTVQVKRITKEQREKGIIDNIDRPWKERDHSLFVGYAPIKKPKYAISVIVEHGGSGSKMAAPIARDILGFILKKEEV